MKKISITLCLFVLFSFFPSFALDNSVFKAESPKVTLGNERLIPEYSNLIKGKKLGLITNQTGINSKNESTYNVLSSYKDAKLTALYTPEHGLSGTEAAGKYVSSTIHPTLKIPVYSLYGPNRMPTADMLKNVDILIYDMQDIGSRTYTFVSTLNYCMIAAEKYKKPIIVLDRPNPVGATIVEGFVLEPKYKTFVGIDEMPMAHGMTVGELAKFFNRNINCNLQVIEMKNYFRDMVYQDTKLPWKMTSPNIPDLDSAFGYMATGIGDGTGISQSDKFKFIGSKNIKNPNEFASLLNNSKLEGVKFSPATIGSLKGVKLQITNYHTFNPCKTGIYALVYAHKLTNFSVPVTTDPKKIVMFEKIHGTQRYGQMLKQNLSPEQIINSYQPELNAFKELRKKYLIYPTKDQAQKELDASISQSIKSSSSEYTTIEDFILSTLPK